MKVIGVISLVIGAALFTIWMGTGIAMASERGVAEAIRHAVFDRPGNIAQFTMLALSLVFGIGGVSLLTAKHRPRN